MAEIFNIKLITNLKTDRVKHLINNIVIINTSSQLVSKQLVSSSGY